jgi:hypothetical protein
MTRITGTLHEDRRTFLIISHSVLLKVRNVSDKVVEKTERRIVRSVTFFPENNAVNVIMWKNMEEPDRPQMTIQYGVCALHAGYLRLPTHTVILTSFTRQQWLRERA